MINHTEIETMRELLVYALTIMDKKGKGTPKKSRTLWEIDWENLRLTLIELIDMVDESRDEEEA